MKIVIKEREHFEGVRSVTVSASYVDKLRHFAGRTIEADTHVLWVDGFTVKNPPAIPIESTFQPGTYVGQISCPPLILEYDVAEVIDDVRPGSGFCESCHVGVPGAVKDNMLGSICANCGGTVIGVWEEREKQRRGRILGHPG